MHELVGQLVMNRTSRRRGRITNIKDKKICVSYGEEKYIYPFPEALSNTLIMENEILQQKYINEGLEANWESFKTIYLNALKTEIVHLKATGGRRYRIIDGERLHTDNSTFIYSFETDSELHFPDGTAIKLWFQDNIISAHVISCEEFTITIQTLVNIGEKVETVEFTAEPWQLMEGLMDRLNEIDISRSKIAHKLACEGRYKMEPKKGIDLGQDMALKKSASQSITFIWGPPGTGKTTTLAKIALEHILKGERVLMLSYSNVSVDGALMKIADMSEQRMGQIIRYGYPRVQELLDSKTLTSYAYILYKNPELADEYKQLVIERKKLEKKDPRRIELRKKINKIREKLLDQERLLIQKCPFVATTVSKAVVDKTIYEQKFDMVIFDEASMAYVPQIVFSASLASKYFCCLGDFKQLPAIVESNIEDSVLEKDIFEYTGITTAVEEGYGHEWLVMLNCQYRMHPQIADLVSRYMYQGLLYSADHIYEHRQIIADLPPFENKPMGLLDLSSTYSVCIRTKDASRINLLSAMACIKLAEEFAEEYKIGIITPYSAQSRLILAMIRDLQEKDEKYKTISSATVHQFQGSEKPIIIYDAVDCFRMPYPGMLLTTSKNDTANRLFNVALTRTQGKFILVANIEYLYRKNISKNLFFSKTMSIMKNMDMKISGDAIFEELGTEEDEYPKMFLGDRDEVDSWNRYLRDIENAKTEIFMDVPGVIDDDADALNDLASKIEQMENNGIQICVRVAENISLPRQLKKYALLYPYVTTPITIIDKKIIWYGEPLSAADFISEGNILNTKYFPCLRFEGKHTARILKAILEIPSLREKENNNDATGIDSRGAEKTELVNS